MLNTYTDFRKLKVPDEQIEKYLKNISKTEEDCMIFFGPIWTKPGVALHTLQMLTTIYSWSKKKDV